MKSSEIYCNLKTLILLTYPRKDAATSHAKWWWWWRFFFCRHHRSSIDENAENFPHIWKIINFLPL